MTSYRKTKVGARDILGRCAYISEGCIRYKAFEYFALKNSVCCICSMHLFSPAYLYLPIPDDALHLLRVRDQAIISLANSQVSSPFHF